MLILRDGEEGEGDMATAEEAEVKQMPDREFVYVEHTKGVNGLDKVTLREVRGFSAEVWMSDYFTCSALVPRLGFRPFPLWLVVLPFLMRLLFS